MGNLLLNLIMFTHNKNGCGTVVNNQNLVKILHMCNPTASLHLNQCNFVMQIDKMYLNDSHFANLHNDEE